MPIRRSLQFSCTSPTSPLGGGFFDFTTGTIQDPLSWGGRFTNNTQGTGGNVAMNAQSSVRIEAASGGGMNMAGGDSIGQSVPPAADDYMDSFAFLPGFPGNQRITAKVYKDPAYTAGDNHEIELLLGCSSSAGSRRWIENLWGLNGEGRAMVSLTGPANGFTVLSPTDSGALNRDLVMDDIWVAELYRSTNTVITYLNGTQILSLTNGTFISGLGDGIGIATFRRTALGSTNPAAYGFKTILLESF